MSGSTPNYQILVGNGKYEDYVCTGYILCDGSFAECLNVKANNWDFYNMITAPDCDIVSSSTVSHYYWNNNQWNYWVSAAIGGFPGYSYTLWPNFNGPFYNKSIKWKSYDSTTDSTRYWYQWYYTFTVHCKDLLGVNMAGIDVYIDGEYIGVTGTSGSVSVFTTLGNHIVECIVTSAWFCSGYTFDAWSPTQCSWTVNVTGDQTQECTFCMTNDCRYYHHIIYDPYHNPGSGPTQLCVGCSPNSWPCYSGRWIAGGSYYGAYIAVKQIFDEIPKRVTFCYNWPWGNEIECSYEEDMHPNSWSATHTDATYGSFKFRIGDIWSSGGTWWVRIEDVCWTGRPNLGTVSDIDKSVVYVDCTNGDDEHSGLCDFDHALKTITKAQSIVANNGIIKVLYGNCHGENLNAVLNPIHDIVHISPVQSKTVEGTGTLSINDS